MYYSKVTIFRQHVKFDYISLYPGNWVVIKPNLVKQHKETDPNEWASVITSPNLIKQVCLYVCQKLEGNGRISICDAPQTDSSFSEIRKLLDMEDFIEDCKKKYGIPIEFIDLRNEEWVNKEGVIVERKKIGGDINGSIAYNLGKHSFFYGNSGEGKYYGADYESKVVNYHHSGERQEYLLAGTPMKCDVFINMPKLKTHKKTGVTLNLKNLVGINADKNWLPHHTEGSPRNHGDQFPDMSLKRRLEQVAVSIARTIALKLPVLGPRIAIRMRKAGSKVFGETQKVIRSGNWYGNNTTWRMALDLNRCLLYGQEDGTLNDNIEPKRYYSVLDGIIGMEGQGPMQGEHVDTGIVIGGEDPVAVDMVAARVMGFDWRKIPVIREAFNIEKYPITKLNPEHVQVESDVKEWNGNFINEIEKKEFFHFEPHFGWKGHIEYNRE